MTNTAECVIMNVEYNISEVIMKKIISILSLAAITMSLCSCGEGGLFGDPIPTPEPMIDAAEVLTIDNVKTAVADNYTVELEGGGAVTEGNVTTASYRANPVGSGDPIIVEVIQSVGSVSEDTIWADYEAKRLTRSSAQLVEGIGEDAYIAYPSIHVYNKGTEIVITAGSGSDEGQANYLKDLAKTAVANIEAMNTEAENE